jgi:protein SFI1
MPFHPTRTSPTFRPTTATSDSRSTTHSIATDVPLASPPELTNLTQDEIELIDAVIQRAGSSATTFLTVFKAYNDVLTERGLDPQEVLYYGKLLKIGTMKGKNWGEKWNTVKAGFQSAITRGSIQSRTKTQDKSHPPITRAKTVSKNLPLRGHTPLRQVDNIQLKPSQEPSILSSPPQEEPSSISQYKSRIPPGRTKQKISLDSPLTVETRSRSRKFEPTSASPRSRFLHTETDLSENSSGLPSSTPPSYHAIARDTKPALALLRQLRNRREPTLASSSSASEVAEILLTPDPPTRLQEIEEVDDPWKKIQMKRDEENADLFRADRLQERCYEIWKQGFEWILVGSYTR